MRQLRVVYLAQLTWRDVIIGTAHIWLIVVAEPVPVAIADADEEEEREEERHRRKQLRRDAQFARREERCACLL